jgi:GrpB-like predicted nucleotidyltransferase (UPF0157 family)
MGRKIEVIAYDPQWPADFERESTMLARIFGQRLLDIQHIGSTAVPNLAAKPIIDILIVLDHTADIDSFNPSMEGLSYRVRGECLDAIIPGTPGRFYFTKETNGVRSHHVHIYAKGHADILDKLAFRDYLRTHQNVALAYAELKRRLAVDHRFDNIGYMRGKDDFVKSVLREARCWYAKSV